MDKYIGKKLDGRYEILELVGFGGMAVVFKAYDLLENRHVAVKILKDEYLHNEEFRRRFRNESKAIAMLSHPNIVRVFDVNFSDTVQYIVMEYIDGITLKEYIGQQGAVKWKETIHSVSYTHLDVYKRQLRNGAAAITRRHCFWDRRRLLLTAAFRRSADATTIFH